MVRDKAQFFHPTPRAKLSVAPPVSDGGSEGTPAEPGERYSQATTTNPFLMPGNTWVTPEAAHGQECILVLPIVNMFKYNITDVIITPRLGAKTDDFPFEITNNETRYIVRDIACEVTTIFHGVNVDIADRFLTETF